GEAVRLRVRDPDRADVVRERFGVAGRRGPGAGDRGAGRRGTRVDGLLREDRYADRREHHVRDHGVGLRVLRVPGDEGKPGELLLGDDLAGDLYRDPLLSLHVLGAAGVAEEISGRAATVQGAGWAGGMLGRGAV